MIIKGSDPQKQWLGFISLANVPDQPKCQPRARSIENMFRLCPSDFSLFPIFQVKRTGKQEDWKGPGNSLPSSDLRSRLCILCAESVLAVSLWVFFLAPQKSCLIYAFSCVFFYPFPNKLCPFRDLAVHYICYPLRSHTNHYTSELPKQCMSPTAQMWWVGGTPTFLLSEL